MSDRFPVPHRQSIPLPADRHVSHHPSAGLAMDLHSSSHPLVQSNAKGRAWQRAVLNEFKFTVVVIAHDFPCTCESKSDPSGLGCEVRIEDDVGLFEVNARSTVGEYDVNL